MATDTWLLMRLYWKLDRREAVGRSKLRGVALILGWIGVLFIGAMAAAVGYGAAFLTRPDLPVRIPPGVVPGLMLTFVLVGVLFTGLNQAVKSLFLSGDLDRLMVAPVRTRSVMVAKLFSRLPTTILLLLLIAAPAFVGYGIGISAGPVYYVVGAVFLLLAPLFGLSVGALLAMLLVRWLPVKRLNEMLAAAYAFIGIGLALLFQLPRLFLDNGDFAVDLDSTSLGPINTLAETIDRLPIPTFWAGRGLVALDAGAIDAVGLLGIGAYVLITLGLFLGIILTADRLYLSGWLKTQSAGGKRRGLEDDGGVFGGRSLAMALGWKDWLLRFRDPQQLVSLLGGGLIAIVVGGLAIFRGSGGNDSLMSAVTSGQIDAPGAWGILTSAFSPGALMAGFAFFIGYVFLSNMSTYALALEGGAFPLLKAAPIRPREVWSAKLWSVFLPFVVLYALVMVGSWFFTRYSLAWLPYALAAGFLLGCGLLASGVSVGFRYANLAWKDPRRMTTGGGGWVSLLLSVLYGLPAGIIVFLGFGVAQVFPTWSIPVAGGALLLLALFTWGVFLWARRWAEKSWDKLPV